MKVKKKKQKARYTQTYLPSAFPDEQKAKGYGQNIVHSLLLTSLSHAEYKK
jgi:hypothetical protein